MATQEVNGYFHDNGIYPNVVTLMVARSQQVFTGPDGRLETGEGMLRQWFETQDNPDYERIWLSPARATKGGGVRIKMGNRWHTLCDDAQE